MSETLIDRIVQLVNGAGAYDPNVVVEPEAIIWTDEQRQWEVLIPHLRNKIPIVEYGAYEPDAFRGPAYWLRCVVAKTIVPSGLPDGRLVLYLPGVSREMLRTRAVGNNDLGAVGGLQHRSTWFGHPNGRDWTVRSLLTNTERGLGLDVAGDAATTDALILGLNSLAAKPMAQLERTHIDAAFLNDLFNPDPVRSLLDWLNDPSGFRNACSDQTWAAFAQQIKQRFGADVARGEIECARLLGEADGDFAQVWQRYREMPSVWPGIVDRLRQAQPHELVLRRPGAWPGFAEQAEARLRQDLIALADSPPSEARSGLLALEDEHKERRSHVWADLGMTPLVLALEYAAVAARLTGIALPAGGGVAELTAWYGESGWQTDQVVLAALAESKNSDDMVVIANAVNAVYKPWLRASAEALQGAIGPAANGHNYVAEAVGDPGPGEVVVFVDGLRLDTAYMLAAKLTAAGREIALTTALAALPTVTDTAKPAVAPLDPSRLTGGSGLELRREPDGRKYDIDVLRGLLTEGNVQILKGAETGDTSGSAWTETGDLDKRGHEFGIALVHELDDELRKIAERITRLLDAGWSTVSVVTDHGWLLLHGGLDKNELLPQAHVDIKKGRCARVTAGADPNVPTVPWHWDRDVRIAVANGITCFTANQEYEHGGVSLQECVVPRLTVRSSPTEHDVLVAVRSVKWRGLTLSVEFDELPDNATVDVRTVAGDASSSVIDQDQLTAGSRKRVLFASDDHEGEDAVMVVTGPDGSILFQLAMTVGQNR